ncbi:Sensor histidine kinase LiaS [bioreactor metagenome]|uniref:Sensor histidine kinase LiaS n=1 Tax=bioreactor metagenome TaxID=1076179 RepID=A0A644YK15_9ZZZZ
MNSSPESPNLRAAVRTYLSETFSNMGPVWPFFALVTVAMIVIYGITLANVPALHQPWLLIVFTVAMILHTALHWCSPLAAKSPTASLLYLFVQLSLLLGMVFLTRFEPLTLGLFMGMAGEMLGVIRPLKRSIFAVLALIATVLLLHGWMYGWVDAWSFFITLFPLTFFVVIYVYLFTKQLEEKQRAESLLKELEVAHKQLGEYAVQIEDLTLNNERQRMARELHDTLSQGLAGVILQLEAAWQHLENGNSEKAQAIVKQAGTRARSTLAEARQVIDDLRNNTPAAISLDEYIRDRAEHFTSLTGLPCELNLDASLPINNELAQHIEKIVSEGLTNILRHASASKSWVSLHREDGLVRLEIGDDGQGFDAQELASNGHYGLVGIRERTRLNQGTFQIQSTPGKGTCLVVTFPISMDMETL